MARAVEDNLDEWRASCARIFQRLCREGKSRFLPMRYVGRVLYFVPGEHWILYERGHMLVKVDLCTSSTTEEDETLFVDALIAFEGMDLERLWFDPRQDLP